MKIEYKIMKWPEVFDVGSRDPVQSSLEELLKDAGSRGWDLVVLKNQYMIFKRPEQLRKVCVRHLHGVIKTLPGGALTVRIQESVDKISLKGDDPW